MVQASLLFQIVFGLYTSIIKATWIGLIIEIMNVQTWRVSKWNHCS